ncbi:TetR/AcrR family transcriptional regulator [Variovorax sp. V15]|uniref:TetR/AcrR family transcriptional regulator n=2 Tax=unclassified Variovorax TaxID=663243 RepID=UPI0034E8AB5E
MHRPSVPRRTHAERSAATRKHLIATAIDVIQTRSLEDMSIHELARTAGMTSGAVQHHFESKAVLMMQVLGELIQSGVDAGELWPAETLPLHERASAFVNAAWQLIYAQPRFVAAWNIYLGTRNQPEVLAQIASLRIELGEQMEAGFFGAFPELENAADRHAVVGLVFSALRGLGLLQLFPSTAEEVRSERSQAQLACLADLIVAHCEAAAAPRKPRKPSRAPSARS